MSFSHTPSQTLSSSSSLLPIVETYLARYASGTPHTSKAKQGDTQYFLTFLASFHKVEKDALKLSHFSTSAVERFIDERLNVGESPATVSRRLATVRHLGRVLSEELESFRNPVRNIKTPSTEEIRPKNLTSHTVQNLQEATDLKEKKILSFKETRDSFLVTLLMATGLRADEIRLLRFGQLSEDKRWFKEVKTKGRKFRNVYISSELDEMLEEYIDARMLVLSKYFSRLPQKTNKSLPFLISTWRAHTNDPQSFRLSPKTVWRVVHSYSTDTHLHPHLLRHTFAHRLLEQTNDIRLVSQALGHSDVRVTMKYTERSDEDIARAIEDSQAKS